MNHFELIDSEPASCIFTAALNATLSKYTYLGSYFKIIFYILWPLALAPPSLINKKKQPTSFLSYLQGTPCFPYICWLSLPEVKFLPLSISSPHLFFFLKSTYIPSCIVLLSLIELSRNLRNLFSRKLQRDFHLKISLKALSCMMPARLLIKWVQAYAELLPDVLSQGTLQPPACSLAGHSTKHRVLDQQSSISW